ncbi:MAG: hypothetical protein MRZ75_01640 [Roseburia sp.]|nr:hypothetical protein [Roseburia sp.]MDD6216568.1 hypothetical protein [Roseburia sp.]MDY5882662.1 hypothetical protein [Roseburia sp.]
MRNIKKKISLSLVALLTVTNLGTVVAFAKESNENQTSDEIVYTEDVMTDFDLDASIKEQPDGNYEVVTEDTSAEELETGNIIVVPAQEDGVERAIEVTNVTKTEEGYVIEGEEPDSIFDVVESVDTQGTAEVDTDAVIPADGVSVTSAADAMDTARSGSWREWFTFTSNGTTTMTGLNFHLDKQLGTNASLTGDFVIDPSLEYHLVFDLTGVKEMTAAINTRMKVTDVSVTGGKAGSIPIATLPYTFADGMFSAFITLNLVYSAQGEVFLSYEMSGICGVTYDGTDTSLICSYQPEVLDYGASADGKVGAEFEITLLAYGTYNVMNADVNSGFIASAQKESGQNGIAEVYFYLDGNYGYGSILEPYGICGSKVIYGKDNSPFHYVFTQ